MNFYGFVDGLTNLIPVTLLLGLGLCAYRYRRLAATYRLLCLYLLLALVADVASRVWAYTQANNLALVLLYGFFELLFFAGLYFLVLLHKPAYAMRVLVLAGLLYMLWEMTGLSVGQPARFQSYVRVADAFLVVLLSLLFFLERMRKLETPEWPFFRLNAAILVYFSISFVFYLPMNFLINQRTDTKMVFWLVYILATWLFYVYLICEICINGSNRKRLPSG